MFSRFGRYLNNIVFRWLNAISYTIIDMYFQRHSRKTPKQTGELGVWFLIQASLKLNQAFGHVILG